MIFKAASSIGYTCVGFNFLFGDKYVRQYSSDHQRCANVLRPLILSNSVEVNSGKSLLEQMLRALCFP